MNGVQERLELALAIAKAAGAVALGAYQSHSLSIETKRDRTVVTAADRAAERLLRERIQQGFPGDAIVGEEYGVSPGTSGWTWYLDPIDGTQAFVRGVPLFGTLIGVEYQGVSEIGVIFLPALGEMVHAAKGLGCHWTRGLAPLGPEGFTAGETVRARVSEGTALDEALFCTTWMRSYQEIGRVDLFGQLCAATGVFRGWGDCYGYALVATGRAEIMVDPVLEVWDAAPLLVVIEEAGGRYTTFGGERSIHGRSGVATNGRLHDAVMALVRS